MFFEKVLVKVLSHEKLIFVISEIISESKRQKNTLEMQESKEYLLH